MSLMAKLARVAKPGMFTAVLVGVAITAAATYTSKLAMEYDHTLDAAERAKDELGAIETHRASLLLEIEEIQSHRQELFKELHASVVSEVLARVQKDITGGAYDEAVNARAMELAGHRVVARADVNTEQ